MFFASFAVLSQFKSFTKFFLVFLRKVVADLTNGAVKLDHIVL